MNKRPVMRLRLSGNIVGRHTWFTIAYMHPGEPVI